MGRITAIVAIGGLVFAASASRAQDERPIEDPPIPAEKPAKAPSASLTAEAAAARVVAAERLRALKKPAEAGKGRDKAAEARVAALVEVYKSREILLTDWDKTVKARRALEHPDPTPEAEMAELKAALERARGALARASKDPVALLPDLFRSPLAQTSEASLSEMKDALDAADDAVENARKGLEASTAAAGKKSASPLASARADRDEIRKRIAALTPRGNEAEAALAAAGSADERELARERIINLVWEGRVEAERLQEAEVRIDLETRRAASNEIKIEVEKIRLELARTTLGALQKEYRKRVDWHKADIQRASATEGVRAAHAGDPLERYKARRNKEILDLKALCSDLKGELGMTPVLTLAEQAEKADKAAADFKRLKELVGSKRSTALVAQRLNNSFRRLGGERAAIVRNELATITALLTRYENELTAVELDELNDVRGDQALRDNLLATLPAARKAEALADFVKLEREHRKVDEERRGYLIQLEKRAEDTRQQILRRLKILDEQHVFVRTHLFWVRDSQPMGTSTVEQIRREAREVAAMVFGLLTDPWSRSAWPRATPEFGLAAMGLLVLPYGLYRARKWLRTLLERERLGRAIHHG